MKTKLNLNETKIGLKMEAEKLRRKEIVENYRQLQQAKKEFIEAKSNLKETELDFVYVCKSTDDSKKEEAQVAFDMAQKEYSEAKKNVELLYMHLRDLEALKQQSKVDHNVVLKCATFAGITFFTMLVELPGNLVNLRAIKVVKPITDLLKL